MEDDRAFDAEPREHIRHLAGQVPVGDAEGLVPGAGGIAEGADDVEERAHAELPPRYTGKAKRRMEDRSEEKPNAGLVDAARDAFGSEVDLHAQLLEHVGRTAQRRSRAISMLGHLRPARRRHNPRERGDVERRQAIAAGPACVEELAVDLDRRGERASCARKAGDLVDSLALHPQGDHEPGDLDRGGVTAHDRLEGGGSFGFAERLASHELRYRADHAETLAARLMKLLRIFLPSFVSTDSGWNWTP